MTETPNRPEDDRPADDRLATPSGDGAVPPIPTPADLGFTAAPVEPAAPAATPVPPYGPPPTEYGAPPAYGAPQAYGAPSTYPAPQAYAAPSAYPAPPTYGAPPAYGSPAASAPSPSARNPFGLTALITGIVAIVLAAIPFAAFIAWLPAIAAVAFGIAALVTKRSAKRGQGLTGLILGSIAFVLSIIMSVVSVFLVAAVSINAVNDSIESGFDSGYTGDDTDVEGDPSYEADTQIVGGSAAGTAEDPFPIGETVEIARLGEPLYSITIVAPNLDADDLVAAEADDNDSAPDGSSYVLVPVTVTYHDDALSPGSPVSAWEDLYLTFVTADGEEIEENYGAIPDAFFDLPDLQPGESGTGNYAFIVPDDAIADGTWLVSVGWELEYHVDAR
ncbi:hypothetical protein BJ978_002200 [Agromyces terreus]|uniref:DUF4190 domain-containing protein n=1 Tax=Agromyces terreus TaxID=424795 RepID=A0A9X2H7R9_9MICO|nr:DUF4190 domain-containing protein [Agromyces terreus]MCP2371524.1 hypothetical protein [Agromyces terreus]